MTLYPIPSLVNASSWPSIESIRGDSEQCGPPRSTYCVRHSRVINCKINKLKINRKSKVLLMDTVEGLRGEVHDSESCDVGDGFCIWTASSVIAESRTCLGSETPFFIGQRACIVIVGQRRVTVEIALLSHEMSEINLVKHDAATCSRGLRHVGSGRNCCPRVQERSESSCHHTRFIIACVCVRDRDGSLSLLSLSSSVNDQIFLPQGMIKRW
ncbi:hypothetical protein CALVIDRAFT_184205 [Calocera viscosa TUFC12733]|uniref:Uncharacterized protein n=1 Tax=Calocera viscosa (strain TUFC12733) TaxID=1330018 RepID=A0A167L2V0_CALVF|nr:hypothetical protein CALVIDRAFT_184205 [Calocera viscosa TUFC12733]